MIVRALRSVLGLILASCGPAMPSLAAPDNSQMEHVLNNTVALVTHLRRPFCAGALHEGLVITAAHCVDDPDLDTEYQVALREDYDFATERFVSSWSYVVQFRSDDSDLAVLRPASVGPTDRGLRLDTSDSWAGRRVVTVGHPYGLVWTITEGVVSARRCDGHFAGCYLQTSGPVSPGNSGGPVVNQYGELVGITSWVAIDSHLAFAVPADVVAGAL